MSIRFISLLTLVCALMTASACKKQAAGPAQANAYDQLPEATNVLSALNEKNYEDAIAALAKAKESVETDQQREQYGALTREVQSKLTDASDSDPKAAEAMHALGVMRRGR